MGSPNAVSKKQNDVVRNPRYVAPPKNASKVEARKVRGDSFSPTGASGPTGRSKKEDEIRFRKMGTMLSYYDALDDGLTKVRAAAGLIGMKPQEIPSLKDVNLGKPEGVQALQKVVGNIANKVSHNESDLKEMAKGTGEQAEQAKTLLGIYGNEQPVPVAEKLERLSLLVQNSLLEGAEGRADAILRGDVKTVQGTKSTDALVFYRQIQAYDAAQTVTGRPTLASLDFEKAGEVDVNKLNAAVIDILTHSSKLLDGFQAITG